VALYKIERLEPDCDQPAGFVVRADVTGDAIVPEP